MSERLTHRGPDGEGTHITGPVALAHRRLAIIDLSEDGLQPMTSEDGTLWLVFNGEIYNFVELREELIEKGHRFHSKSDTEVILHAYEEWGHECLTRFNGMWAFALWDGKRQELFCARDRFGIKPFYYAQTGDSFLFASEIKALLAHPAVGKKPDDATLGTYLAWGVHDHSERTMFDGILQLRPAHAMVVTKEGAQSPFRYWDVKVNTEIRSTVPDEEVASKAPLPCCTMQPASISGAMSLSAPASPGGLIRRHSLQSSTSLSGKRLRQVSGHNRRRSPWSFPTKDLMRAGISTRLLPQPGLMPTGTEPSPEKLWDDIDRLVYMQDEPFGSLSIYAQYCVMQLAHEQVKVVLDGQGADEFLAGYLAYQGSYIGGLFRSFHALTGFREIIGSLRHHRGFFRSAVEQLFVRKGRRGLLKCTAPPVDRYGGTLDEVLLRELTGTNLPALLHYEDRNSMAFSIESRVPYLDVRFVEYVASLPLNQKIRNGITKIALRNAIKGIIPESIRCRMDKMGFVTPEEIWMKEALRPFVLELVSSDEFQHARTGMPMRLSGTIWHFLRGKSAYSPEIWRIVCTELWLRKFFDMPASASAGS